MNSLNLLSSHGNLCGIDLPPSISPMVSVCIPSWGDRPLRHCGQVLGTCTRLPDSPGIISLGSVSHALCIGLPNPLPEPMNLVVYAVIASPHGAFSSHSIAIS